MSQWESTDDEFLKTVIRSKLISSEESMAKNLKEGLLMTFTVEIGSKSMIAGFEDGLIGLKKGDQEDLES